MLDIDVIKNKLSDIRCCLSDHFGDKIWLKIGTDSTCKFKVLHVYDNTYRVGRGIADIYYIKSECSGWCIYILPLNSDYDAFRGRYYTSPEFPNLYGFGTDEHRICRIIEEMLDFKKRDKSTPIEQYVYYEEGLPSIITTIENFNRNWKEYIDFSYGTVVVTSFDMGRHTGIVVSYGRRRLALIVPVKCDNTTKYMVLPEDETVNEYFKVNCSIYKNGRYLFRYLSDCLIALHNSLRYEKQKEAPKVSKYKVIGHTIKMDGSDLEFTVTVKPVIPVNYANPCNSDRLNKINTLYDELKDRIECASSTRVETALSCPTPNASIPGAESKSCKPFPLGIAIKDVKFNDPYTIVFWEDGKKTMVKCRKGDTYNKETGLALCIIKRALGNRWGYYNIFKHWIPELKCVKNYAKEDYEIYHKEKLTKEDLDETVIANLTLSEVSLDPGDAAQILKPYCDVKVDNSDKPEDNGNVNE